MTQTVRMVFAALEEVNAQMRALEQRKKELSGQLQAVIPEGGEMEGIRHVVSTREQVSYAKALQIAHDKLSGKARAVIADAIEECSQQVTSHRFQPAKGAV